MRYISIPCKKFFINQNILEFLKINVCCKIDYFEYQKSLYMSKLILMYKTRTDRIISLKFLKTKKKKTLYKLIFSQD